MRKWIAVFPLAMTVATSSYAGDLEKAQRAFKEGACGLALAEAKEPAARGDQDAQFLLAEIYSSGIHDCERDFRDEAKAQHWYRTAAEAGHLEAQQAMIYRFDDTPEQRAESDRWTRLVAQRGNAGALERLAQMYADGERVKRDPVVALALKTIAAAQGGKPGKDDKALHAWQARLAAPQVAEANELAAAWRPGAALPERSATGQRPALEWLREAAEGGDPQAAYRLGQAMWDEGGATADQAAPWLRRAASAGIREAQQLLAHAIAHEAGERYDPGLAYALATLAGSENAAHWERELTPRQLREARQFLASWKPGQPLPQAFASAAERKYRRARVEPARAAATPQVMALFDAARKADAPAFERALAQVRNIDDYRVEGMTLLAALLRPDPALLRQGRELAGLAAGPRLARWQDLRAQHQAQLPARARMLAQLLARKPDLHRGSGTGAEPAAALHFAAMFGSPAMVRQLLAAGADPAQLGGVHGHYAPLEYALAQEAHSEGLPEMTTPEQRTETILALLRAGAPRPLAAAIEADLAQAKAKGKEYVPFRDHFLWRDLVWLTRGTEVLDKVQALGSQPPAPDPNSAHSLLGEAAFAGNTSVIPWLKKRIGRLDAKGHDRWLDAAMYAAYLPQPKATQMLAALLADGMPWQQSGPQESHSYERFLPLGSRRVNGTTTLAGHVIEAGNNAALEYLLKRGMPLPGALLGRAARANNTAALKLMLRPGVDARETLQYLFEDADVQPATILLLAQHQLRSGQPTAADDHGTLLEAVGRRIGQPGYRQLFGQLLALGGPGDGLSDQAVARIFSAQDKTLALELLDAALPKAASQAARTRYLEAAIVQRRLDLLPRLLKDASVAESSWQLAVAAKDEGLLRALAADKPLRLDAVCMRNDAMLAGVVLESTDAFWTLLRSSGFGSDPARCGDMGERVLRYLAAHPERPAAGWMARVLAARVADLAGGKPQLDARLWADLARNGHGALAQALLDAGWRAPQLEPVPLSSQSKALAGRYVYQRGGLCELDLRQDGTFQLTSTLEGATWYARGAWRAEGGDLVLESAPPAKPRIVLDAEGATTRGGKTVSVELQARGASVPGVELLLLGDAPLALRGKTTVDGWSGTLDGPVRQIVVIDRGSRESHVIEVPPEQAMRRRFVLQAQRGDYDDPFRGKGYFSGGRLTLDMGNYPVTLERQ